MPPSASDWIRRHYTASQRARQPPPKAGPNGSAPSAPPRSRGRSSSAQAGTPLDDDSNQALAYQSDNHAARYSPHQAPSIARTDLLISLLKSALNLRR